MSPATDVDIAVQKGSLVRSNDSSVAGPATDDTEFNELLGQATAHDQALQQQLGSLRQQLGSLNTQIAKADNEYIAAQRERTQRTPSSPSAQQRPTDTTSHGQRSLNTSACSGYAGYADRVLQACMKVACFFKPCDEAIVAQCQGQYARNQATEKACAAGPAK
jgi:hypothetical protein